MTAHRPPAVRLWLPLMVAVGFLLRLGVAWPGLERGALAAFSRPDTPGYLGPALALAAGEGYLNEPGGTPSVTRAPGFPALAALVLRLAGSDPWGALSVTLCALGALTAVGVFLAGREAGGDVVGLVAAALYSCNLTALANAPLLLSDTCFTLVIAFQLYWLLRFRREKRWWQFPVVLALAALATLIRPIEIAWLLPGLVLLTALPGLTWRRRLLAGGVGTALFFAILFPWQYRNAQLGAGYCIDVNTGAMYHQNGAMILAAAHGTSYEQEKQRLIAECDALFEDRERFPDEKSRVDYRLTRLREIILAHPGCWLRGHFQPAVLLPDAPAFFENLGVTSPGRGTLQVLQQEGVMAAVKHYFGPRWYWLLAALLPLLAVVGITYLGAVMMGIRYLCTWRRNWYWLLLILAFIEYFLFLPGPITVPRYQLPALPLLTVLAALAGSRWLAVRRSCRKESLRNGSGAQEKTGEGAETS